MYLLMLINKFLRQISSRHPLRVHYSAVKIVILFVLGLTLKKTGVGIRRHSHNSKRFNTCRTDEADNASGHTVFMNEVASSDTLYSTPYYVGGLGFFFGTVGLGELRV